MTPVHFEFVNRVLGKPASMSEEECSSLPIFTDEKLCVSCWELSDEEITNLVKTKKLYLAVYSGSSQPPVFLTTICPVQRIQ